jgi:3-deoxy-D-manno-octulosonic-acid transferase
VLLFLYHFLWTFIVIIFLPLIPFVKSRRVIERLALGLPPPSSKKESIWIHALSVGEVISALPLVRSLKQQYPQKDIVFTVTTTQGMEIARSELEGEVKALLRMPVDFWWSVRRIVDHIKPSVFILVETDIWPGLLNHLKKRGIKTLLVNGRISPRTFSSYWRFRFFIRIMMNPVEQCLMQSDLDTKRLLQIGIRPDKVKTVGNIKFDRDWVPMSKKEHQNWLNVLNLKDENSIWIAGSTHEREEEIILDAFGRLRPLFPMLRLIIAPRRIERTENIYSLGASKDFKAVLKTALAENGEPYDVLIFDTIGELDRIYGIADISFVGGSLIPEGGHNLLEPANFGVPVLFGPYTDDFALMSEALIEAGGGKRVKDGDELFEAMKGLLSDSERLSGVGRRAKEFVEMNRGALKRVIQHIEGTIDVKEDRAGQ